MKNKIKMNNRRIKHPRVYPVKWCVNSVEIRDSEDLGHFGICGYSKNVAFLDSNPNPVRIIEIRKVSIKNEDCLYSERCLDLKCKYNKTTGDSFVKNLLLPEIMIPENETKKIIDNFEIIIRQSVELFNNKIKREHPELFKFEQYSMVRFKEPLIKNTAKPGLTQE